MKKPHTNACGNESISLSISILHLLISASGTMTAYPTDQVLELGTAHSMNHISELGATGFTTCVIVTTSLRTKTNWILK